MGNPGQPRIRAITFALPSTFPIDAERRHMTWRMFEYRLCGIQRGSICDRCRATDSHAPSQPR